MLTRAWSICRQLVVKLLWLLLSRSSSALLQCCPHRGDELSSKQVGLAWLICSVCHLPTTIACGWGFLFYFSSTASATVVIPTLSNQPWGVQR